MKKLAALAALTIAAIAAFAAAEKQDGKLSPGVEARLDRIVEAMDANADFRKAYHGAFQSSFVTNETTGIIQRIDTHADGYAWTNNAHKAMLSKTLTGQAKAAARRKRDENARARRIEDLTRRIADLEVKAAATATNDTEKVERAKAQIALVAAKRSLAIVTAKTATNTVDVIVTPAKK